MLAHFNNEDQLATVLAHELGHVAARHEARQAWQQKLGQGCYWVAPCSVRDSACRLRTFSISAAWRLS
jgi:predicted Zn-dependent protease